MRKHVFLAPAGKVEFGAGGQEAETGRRKLAAPLARQPRVEALLERMQVDDIGGGIGELRLAQRFRRPIRALLLFREIDVEKVLDEILEAVTVGIGAGQ